MTQETIIQMIKHEGLTLTQVKDAVIDVNGFVGVGLITLGDEIQQYIYHNKRMRTIQPQYGNYGEVGVVSEIEGKQVATNAYGGEIVDPHTLG